MPLVMCERQTSPWLFSWFPRRFSPLHSEPMLFKTDTPRTVLKKKKKKKRASDSFHKRPISAYWRHREAARSRGWPRGAFQLSAVSDLVKHTQQQQQQQKQHWLWRRKNESKMHRRSKPRRVNMDYLPAAGKSSPCDYYTFRLHALRVCMWSLTASCFISHVNWPKGHNQLPGNLVDSRVSRCVGNNCFNDSDLRKRCWFV